MNKTDSLVRIFSSNLCDKFIELAKPLKDCYGIDVVILTKINPDGSFLQINTVPELGEFYWNSDLFYPNPFIRHPDFYSPGMLIFSDQPSEDFQATMRELKHFYCSEHILGTFIKEQNALYWVAYSTTDRSLCIENVFLQEKYILEQFAHYLLQEWKPYFAKVDSYTINIREVLGKKFTENSLTVWNRPALTVKNSLLKEMGVLKSNSFLSLTGRERECLGLLLKGKSSPQIAKKLYLSPRTIESHLNSIKNKLGLQNKSEVVEAALEFHNFGLL